MQTVTARYLQAIRAGRNNPVTVTHRNLTTGAQTVLQVESGQVTADATQAIRRQLTLDVPPESSTWQTLNIPGGEITVTKAVQYIDHDIEEVPVGVFIVDQDSIGYAPTDKISLTCPDRWLKVTRAKMPIGQRSSVASNTIPAEIRRLVEGAWTVNTVGAPAGYPFPGWSQLDMSVTTKVGYLTWADGDRSAAVTDLAKSAALEVFFDATGRCVLRPIASTTAVVDPVWQVDAGTETSVMKAADRIRDRSLIRNAVSVTTAATDLTITPALVENNNPNDPMSTLGPLGYVLEEYASPTVRDGVAARRVALALLQKHLGAAKTLSLDAVSNDALEEQDVIGVVFPRTDRGGAVPYELHVIDTVTIPLTPDGSQQIETRSTGPTASDDA